jgi:hypothetical protein
MRRLIGFLTAAVVPPAVAATAWHQALEKNHLLAAAALLAYEFMIGLLALVSTVAQQLEKRWEDRLVDYLDKMLGRRVSHFSKRYRQSVMSSLRFIDLKGFATIGYYTPELEEVFINVNLAYKAPHDAPEGIIGDVPATATNRYSIHDFINRKRPTVIAIIGVPGSGKTTLIRNTARQLCEAGHASRRSIPIVLYLRDHVGSITQDPNVRLPELLRKALDSTLNEPSGWFDQRLYDGNCVVLLDGLDEVANGENQRKLAVWVEHQIERYPRNDFVITSRRQGYLAAPINGASVLFVCGLTDEQVSKFVTNWYRAVEKADSRSSVTEANNRAQSAADGLLDRLNRTSNLRDLITNPLLLTMIANIHRYRGALPAGRARLYSEICEVLLWRRQEAKNLVQKLSGDEKEVIMRRLAFTMMKQRAIDLPINSVVEIVTSGLDRIRTKLTAREFIALIRSDGLFIERENGIFSFAHHTFQEYLAAMYVRDKGYIEVLTSSVDDNWWRETALLFAARADADPIVSACLDSGTSTALSLAFDCAEQCYQLGSHLRERLDKLLASVFTMDGDSERRKIMATAMVDRHLRDVIRTSTGGYVCAQPITQSIYRLFRDDTQAAVPDAPWPPAQASHSQPPKIDEVITGMRGTDALAFVRWINTVVRDGPEYRLPIRAEVEDSAVLRILRSAPTAYPACSVWVAEGPNKYNLWIPETGVNPYIIGSSAVVDQLHRDIQAMPQSIVQLLLLRAIVTMRVLDRGLELTPVVDAAFDNVLDHVFDLDRTISHAQSLCPSLDLDELRKKVASLRQALHSDYGYASSLVDKVLSALLDALRRSRTQNPPDILHLVYDADAALHLDLATDHAFDRAMNDVMGNALSSALARVLRQNLQPDSWLHAFSRAVIDNVGIARTNWVVPPSEMTVKVWRACRGLMDVVELNRHAESPVWAYQVARDVEVMAPQIFDRRGSLTPFSAASLRLTAICLAAEADVRSSLHLGNAFREITAGLALLELRSSGRMKPSETLLMATAGRMPLI